MIIKATHASSDANRSGIIGEMYERWRAPVAKMFKSSRRIVSRTLLRTQSTIGRIGGIAAGTIIMGPLDFLSFYFIHMFLRSLIVLFGFDSDISVTQTIRKHKKIGLGHLTFLLGWNTILSIPILVLYLATIEVFERFIAPGFLNLDFAYIYALIILGSVLQPLDGVIRAGGLNPWQQTMILRGTSVFTCALIAPFVLLGIDHHNLPYVWVGSALISLILTIGFGGYMLVSRIDLSDWKPPPGQGYKGVLQSVVDYGAARTRNRALMIMVRGMLTIFLGPFAGMTVSAFHFGDKNSRERYFSKFKDKKLVKKATKRAKRANERTPTLLKWATANDRPLYLLVMIALALVCAVYVFRGSANAIILLGMLVVASKMLGVSLRIIVLTMLGSGQPSNVQDDEEEAF